MSVGVVEMEKRKVTLKDIANRVNLSVTTVSYVLSYSDKEKISHTTRLKVLEAAREMGYIPNLAARSLANKRSNLVGIVLCTSDDISSSRLHTCYDIIKGLQGELFKSGYDVVLVTTDIYGFNLDVISKHSFVATFVIDANETVFSEISNHFYTPVVIVDSLIDDEIFYKIIPDYDFAMEQAKAQLGTSNPYLLIDGYTNKKLQNSISKGIEDIFVVTSGTSGADLEQFLCSMENRKGIAVGESLGICAQPYVKSVNLAVITLHSGYSLLHSDITRVEISNERLTAAAVKLMTNVVNLNYESEKVVIVR